MNCRDSSTWHTSMGYARSICSDWSTSSEGWPTRNRACSVGLHAKNWNSYIVFNASGSATPLESLLRDFGDRPWSGCRRPYTLTYITSSGNVLSCCFAPFGHRNAKEYREERVLGNIFQETIEAIWFGERYQAFRQAFESDHPAKHFSQCGLNWSY